MSDDLKYDERDEAIILLLALAKELHGYTEGIVWPGMRQDRLDMIKETLDRWTDE